MTQVSCLSAETLLCYSDGRFPYIYINIIFLFKYMACAIFGDNKFLVFNTRHDNCDFHLS